MTTTKGNIVVEDIKVGDIHYEFEYGLGIECEVLTLPVHNEEEKCWDWTSRNVRNDNVITYRVCEGFSHYGPNLYDYIAYAGVKWI